MEKTELPMAERGARTGQGGECGVGLGGVVGLDLGDDDVVVEWGKGRIEGFGRLLVRDGCG